MDITNLIERATGGEQNADLTHQTERHETFERPPSVAVESAIGRVSVVGEDRSNVSVEMAVAATTQRAVNAVRLTTTGGGEKQLRVVVDTTDEFGASTTVRVTTTVRVPEQLPVASVETTAGAVKTTRIDAGVIESTAGGVEATDVSADRIETTAGGITVTDASIDRIAATAGSITVESSAVDTVETDGGRVTATEIAGDPTIHSDAGNVEVDGVDGYLTASTAAGSITVHNATGIDELQTASGAIDARIDAIRGETTVETDVGTVTVTAGPTVAADVTIDSTVGSVSADGLSDEQSSDDGLLPVGETVTGQIGGGGPPLQITTNAGSVQFQHRSEES